MKKIGVAIFASVCLILSCSSDDDGDDASCSDRIQDTASAAQAFVDATDETYTSLCIEYRTALQLQMDACGDTNGALQALIDGLDDCTLTGDSNSEDD